MTMATETNTHDTEHGMSNAGYVRIALILAAITALEVSTYYVDFGPFFMPALMIMMIVKFLMVVLTEVKLAVRWSSRLASTCLQMSFATSCATFLSIRAFAKLTRIGPRSS